MIIAVGGLKGGSGKSTISINLAVEAFERGKRVLLVDADDNSKTTRIWAQTATERGHAAPAMIVMGATMHRPGQLDRVREAFDWSVIDCPPNSGEVQRSALAIADMVLLPCSPAVSEIWAVGETAALLTEARTYRPDLKAWVVINKQKKRTAIGKAARQALAKAGLPVLKTELCDRVAYWEFLHSGKSVASYAPRDDAALEIRRLVDELEALPIARAA